MNPNDTNSNPKPSLNISTAKRQSQIRTTNNQAANAAADAYVAHLISRKKEDALLGPIESYDTDSAFMSLITESIQKRGRLSVKDRVKEIEKKVLIEKGEKIYAK